MRADILYDLSLRAGTFSNISTSPRTAESLRLSSVAVTALSECWHLDERGVMEVLSNEAKKGDLPGGVG